jgi:hypothetical protein
MKKKEFLKTVQLLADQTTLFRVSRKGEHAQAYLGWSTIGSTMVQNEKIWKKYGTLNNMVIWQKADFVNEILKSVGIDNMKAFPTKSKDGCRLRNV